MGTIRLVFSARWFYVVVGCERDLHTDDLVRAENKRLRAHKFADFITCVVLLDEFYGKLTSIKWIKMTRSSPDTPCPVKRPRLTETIASVYTR